MAMNINTDANQTIDKFSGLNGEVQDTSALNSLFSINFKSEDISSDNNIIDKEYLFDEDDIKLLDYIFHIIPDFQNKKNNLPDLDKIISSGYFKNNAQLLKTLQSQKNIADNRNKHLLNEKKNIQQKIIINNLKKNKAEDKTTEYKKQYRNELEKRNSL